MTWPKFWVEKKWQSQLLMPLSLLVCKIASHRLKRFEHSPPKPVRKSLVIVVGNIVVGGSGKTPFIQWLAKQIKSSDLTYGVVSRGYGGQSKVWPLEVSVNSCPKQVGDEPVLLAKSLKCPVVVAPKRLEAVNLLLKNHSVDVIISDDGLQHFSLPRDLEIVLIDAQREHGNGLCMPAGPLREPVSRLNKVDFVVYNGGNSNTRHNMQLTPMCFRQVIQPENSCDITHFANQRVYAMAGIGNPQRFFKQLTNLKIQADILSFGDHYNYTPKDFIKINFEKPLLMTQKDAVKCVEFAKNNWWYLEVSPSCSQEFSEELITKIHALIQQKTQSEP